VAETGVDHGMHVFRQNVIATDQPGAGSGGAVESECAARARSILNPFLKIGLIIARPTRRSHQRDKVILEGFADGNCVHLGPCG
jgi:hypothetical protein